MFQQPIIFRYITPLTQNNKILLVAQRQIFSVSLKLLMGLIVYRPQAERRAVFQPIGFRADVIFYALHATRNRLAPYAAYRPCGGSLRQRSKPRSGPTWATTL